MDVAAVIQLGQLKKTAAMLHCIKSKKSSSAVPLSSVRLHSQGPDEWPGFWTTLRA